MDKKWKSGDVVRLKIGGPKMIVDRYVPYFAPGYGNAPLGALATESRPTPIGEAVRCVYFTPDLYSPAQNMCQYPAFVEFHEATLEAVAS